MMIVLLINGSPKEDGCINRALMEIQNTLKLDNVKSEIIQVGNDYEQRCAATVPFRQRLPIYMENVQRKTGRRRDRAIHVTYRSLH